jgi:hypothetical protein
VQRREFVRTVAYGAAALGFSRAALDQASLTANEAHQVKVNNGEVALSGTVTERQFKRMAEDVVERCSGVLDVRNEIRVQRDSDSRAMGHNQMKGKSNSGTGMKSPESKTA